MKEHFNLFARQQVEPVEVNCRALPLSRPIHLTITASKQQADKIMKNSMKKLVTILLAACVGCLCFAGIVGCSSDNSASNSSSASASKSDPTKAEGDARYYAGEWVSKSEIVPGQGEVATEQYKIIMNADGTFDVQDNGTSILTGTWEAQSATAGTAKTSDGQEVRLEIAGGSKLIFDGSQSGVKKIICVR